MQTRCYSNAECKGCTSGSFVFNTKCSVITLAALYYYGGAVCNCGTARSFCNDFVPCCDGSPCTSTGICPPAVLNAICYLTGTSECATGSCQPDPRAGPVYSYNWDYSKTISTAYGVCKWGLPYFYIPNCCEVPMYVTHPIKVCNTVYHSCLLYLQWWLHWMYASNCI